VRILLADILAAFGSEVFLLCTLSATITQLATVTQTGLLSGVDKWWRSVNHPTGLTAVANETCPHSTVPRLISHVRTPLADVAPSPGREGDLDVDRRQREHAPLPFEPARKRIREDSDISSQQNEKLDLADEPLPKHPRVGSHQIPGLLCGHSFTI